MSTPSSITAGRAMLVATVLALLTYAPSLANGFALDDEGDIVENPSVHHVTDASRILTTQYRPRTPASRSPYRPVTSLSFALSWSMGGGSPLSFHAFNVALHAVNAALVTLFLTVLGASPVVALAGGAIFAVHPVHVEAVANGVGRADVLMTLFVLLGALAYTGTFRRELHRIAVVALWYALALASKENGVVLPGLLVALWLFAPRAIATEIRRPRWRWQLALYGALGLVLAGYLAVRYQVLGTLIHRDAAPYIVVLSDQLRRTTAVANSAHLARLLVFPLDLSADYGPTVIETAAYDTGAFWTGVAAAAAIGLLAVLAWFRSRWVTLGIVWAAMATLVVSNLIFPVGVWIGERTLYLPSVGVSLAVAGVGQLLVYGGSARAKTWALEGVAVIVLFAGGWSAYRSTKWADSETVFLTLAEEHPESYRAQWWMGQRLAEAGQAERALEWLERAAATNPNELRVQLDYVRALLLAGRSLEAERIVEALPPRDPARDVYLTQSLIQLGDPDRARVAVREGLSRFPGDPRLLGQARQLGVEPGGGS